MSRTVPRRAHGISLIELITVIAILAILIAILIPAVQSARESARRINCHSNLRQVGVALHNFESTHGAFPPSKIPAQGTATGQCDEHELEIEDNPGKCTEHQSWTASCLPFLEETSVADSYHFEDPWSNLRNRHAVMTELTVLLCPSVPHETRVDSQHVRGAAVTDYAAIDQVEVEVYTEFFGVHDPGIEARRGAMAEHVLNPAKRIIDGLSKTLMVAECAGRPFVYVLDRPMNADRFASYEGDEILAIDGSFVADDGIGWADPEVGISVEGASEDGVEPLGPRMINAINMGETYSFHPHGAPFLFADGSVRFLGDDIDPWVYVSLCTRAGNEVVNDFD